jgi:hypothetical protein
VSEDALAELYKYVLEIHASNLGGAVFYSFPMFSSFFFISSPQYWDSTFKQVPTATLQILTYSLFVVKFLPVPNAQIKQLDNTHSMVDGV